MHERKTAGRGVIAAETLCARTGRALSLLPHDRLDVRRTIAEVAVEPALV
jgi:hypothetical protein